MANLYVRQAMIKRSPKFVATEMKGLLLPGKIIEAASIPTFMLKKLIPMVQYNGVLLHLLAVEAVEATITRMRK